MISCHLGSGASLRHRVRSQCRTSMGMTPLEGLVMGTRAGDLDPGVLLDSVANCAARRSMNSSTTVGSRGAHRHRRHARHRTARGRRRRKLPARPRSLCPSRPQIYRRLRRRHGRRGRASLSPAASASTVPLVRHRCLQRLGFLGATLDEERNRSRGRAAPDARYRDRRFARAPAGGRADEERAMAGRGAAAGARRTPKPASAYSIAVPPATRTSARRRSTELFGAVIGLRPKTRAVAAGQFLRRGDRALIGPRGTLEHVRLMGPPARTTRWRSRAATSSRSASTRRCGSRASSPPPPASRSKARAGALRCPPA